MLPLPTLQQASTRLLVDVDLHGAAPGLDAARPLGLPSKPCAHLSSREGQGASREAARWWPLLLLPAGLQLAVASLPCPTCTLRFQPPSSTGRPHTFSTCKRRERLEGKGREREAMHTQRHCQRRCMAALRCRR